MENNLSLSVRMLCRKQGITMRQLAEKMQIAPESLSRAINGNPQLSTIQSIASNLNVEVCHCRISGENPCDRQYKLTH